MKFTKMALVMMSTLAVSTSVLAASSGTLNLQGTVAEIMDIVVTPFNTANTSLNITGGENNTKVGTAVEKSNRLGGYKIKISSPTGGELRNTGDVTKKTTYKIGYDGAAAVTPTVSGTYVKTVSALTGLTTYTSDINATVTAIPNAAAGTYQDTLTVAIEAN
jgi:hypothetical protein